MRKNHLNEKGTDCGSCGLELILRVVLMLVLPVAAHVSMPVCIDEARASEVNSIEPSHATSSHETLMEYAIDAAANLECPLSLASWQEERLIEGAADEDSPFTRSFDHGYNPVSNGAFTLGNTARNESGTRWSSMNDKFNTGALDGGDKVGAWHYLGRVSHLIQDMSSPLHSMAIDHDPIISCVCQFEKYWGNADSTLRSLLNTVGGPLHSSDPLTPDAKAKLDSFTKKRLQYRYDNDCPSKGDDVRGSIEVLAWITYFRSTFWGQVTFGTSGSSGPATSSQTTSDGTVGAETNVLHTMFDGHVQWRVYWLDNFYEITDRAGNVFRWMSYNDIDDWASCGHYWSNGSIDSSSRAGGSNDDDRGVRITGRFWFDLRELGLYASGSYNRRCYPNRYPNGDSMTDDLHMYFGKYGYPLTVRYNAGLLGLANRRVTVKTESGQANSFAWSRKDNFGSGPSFNASTANNYFYFVAKSSVTLTAPTNDASGAPFKEWRKNGSFFSSSRAITINSSSSPIPRGGDTYTALCEFPETVSTPTAISGPSTGFVGQSLSFTASGAASSIGHGLDYQFDWGDGTTSWGGAAQSKSYSTSGTYSIRARARCSTHTSCVSAWSGTLRTVTISSPSIASIVIRHTYRGDLVVKLGVGSLSSPTWVKTVSDRAGGSADDLIADVDITAASAYLPPSASNRWFLEVSDAAGGDTGRIEAFRITHLGQIHASVDPPVAINDYQTSYAYIPPDTTPPTPNPMTWAVEPHPIGPNSITMTATTATDPCGVEYYFDETSGNSGGSDSGWQDSPAYTDSGLTPGLTYTYRVKARDKSPYRNEASYSVSRSATVPLPPAITSITPTSGPKNTYVRIEGQRFGVAAGSVRFAGGTASIVSWSDSVVSCCVPESAVTGNVVVQSAALSDSNAVGFTVTTPSTIRVSKTGVVPGIENGADAWPFSTIQRGIDAASDGAMVIVADGTYTGDGNRDIDFKGKAIHLKSSGGAGRCIIDCQGTMAEPHRGFYFHSGEGNGAVVDGFTIANGYHSGGVGVCVLSGSPTITGNTISGNRASRYGGGIHCDSSSPTISNNTISGNMASSSDGGGGGISCDCSSSPAISGNTISGNMAWHYGGGIYCDSSSLAITGNTITGNTASYGGGGIYCDWDNASLAITGNTISGNTACFGAGGIQCYSSFGQSSVNNTILWGNSAPLGPAIRLGYSSTLAIGYSLVSGGRAGVYVSTTSTLTWGPGNTDADPLFADPANGDYHLKSRFGRWDRSANSGAGAWVNDSFTSPCIDAGDPNSDYSNEPQPNGGRINMGAYGNTAGASRSGPWWKIPNDVNDDCTVNVLDLILVRNKLGQPAGSGANWKCDVNQDGTINVLDLILTRNRLGQKCTLPGNCGPASLLSDVTTDRNITITILAGLAADDKVTVTFNGVVLRANAPIGTGIVLPVTLAPGENCLDIKAEAEGLGDKDNKVDVIVIFSRVTEGQDVQDLSSYGGGVGGIPVGQSARCTIFR